MKKLFLLLGFIFVAFTSSLLTALYFFIESEELTYNPIESLENAFEDYNKIAPMNRVVPLSNPKVIDHFNEINSRNKITSISKLYSEENLIIKQLINAIAQWPSNYREFLWSRVARIYITEGLHSSGMAEYVDNGNTFIILINRTLLSQEPNEWLTSTEETAFKYIDDNEKIYYRIEDSNEHYLTLENVITHELGHIIGLNKQITPDWARKTNHDSYPFFKGAFYSNMNKLHRTSNNEFIDLQYYQNEEQKKPFQQYLYHLKALNQTDYPTLYGTANEQEYFAEYFYLYFHCFILSKPYQVILEQRGNETVLIDNPLSESRCSDRFFKLIEALKPFNSTVPDK